MNNKYKKIEVLAPCGSYDILVAAIHAGADACYIGGNCFGARAYAQNFDQETIEKAVSYAHLHGVKVYLTVNTLLKQDELSLLYDYIKPFYEVGGDALIIQDLGVFLYVREQFPDIAIHCSTQMNITSRYGAELMKKQGATRIVTAREMTLDEIRDIKEHVDIEIETFVHGAMCYSYSGQCLMSSLAGGRSGNRGRCAQPCRKCYNNHYLLSMKDMCALSLIPQLIEAGIDSLKIEGRMKNAYYVASAVHAYRTIADDYINGCYSEKKAATLIFELANIYNRGGFCDGYFFQHNGSDMISLNRPNNQGIAIGTLEHIEHGTAMIRLQEDLYPQDVLELITKENEVVEITSSKAGKAGQLLSLNCPKTKQLKIGQPVYRTKCPNILQHVQENYIDCFVKTPVTIALFAHVGEPLSVTITCNLRGKKYITAISDHVVDPSRQQTISYEMIKKPFGQLGNTEYILEEFLCETDRDAFLPNGLLKKMRRAVLAKLEDCILSDYHRNPPEMIIPENMERNKQENISSAFENNQTIIGVTNYEQFVTVKNELLKNNICISGITVPLDIYAICRKQTPESICIYGELPHVIHNDFSVDLQEMRIRGIYIRNIDGLAVVSNAALPTDCKILCDASLYCYNRLAHTFIKQLIKHPVSFLTPRELKLEEMTALANEANCLMLYEYQPVMLTANCLQRTKNNCTGTDTIVSIIDDIGNRFFAKTFCRECYNVIYNKVPYCILDKYKKPVFDNLHSAGYMLRFTIEDEAQIVRILQIFSGKSVDIHEKTSGHLYRGVL